MIVMSTSARALLNKLQARCPMIEYDMIIVEWYSHSFTLRLLEAWWKIKMNDWGSFGSTFEWYLPKTGTSDYDNLLQYIIDKSKKVNLFNMDCTENHKQVYHYLCSNALTNDFGLNELRMILGIGSEFTIQTVQHIIENVIKGVDIKGSKSHYIMAVLRREKQSKEIKVDRIVDAIDRSQQYLKPKNTWRATDLDIAIMRTVFKDIRERQDTDKAMEKARKQLKRQKII